MPSHERTRRFERDYKRLTANERSRFATALRRFDEDLAGGRFRGSLRIKRVEGTDAIFEMTWAPDGRATFEYGDSQGEGAHVVWRRIGTIRYSGAHKTTPCPAGGTASGLSGPEQV